MNKQASSLQKLMSDNGIDAFIAYKPQNTRYLTGFKGVSRVDGHTIVDRAGVHFLANSMNREQAAAEVEKGIDVTVMEYRAMPGKYLADKGYKRVAIEESFLTVEELDDLKRHMPDADFIYGAMLLNEVRHIKTPEQIASYRRACEITDGIFAALLNFFRAGVTETEIESFILAKTKELGAEGPYFTPIVVSGARSSEPHGQPTDKKLENGDFVTVDMGVIYNGCASDFTRTVVIGKASDKQREIYDTVKRAQQKALDGIRVGMMSDEADSLARNLIKEAGYGEYFPHSLGHGLDDGVRLSQLPEHRFVLEENMIFTVEPGIYIEGLGGVRIEDTVLLTKDGCVPFYSSTKELLEICR